MYEDKVHKIIQGIAAAMANSYDGATDEKGDPIKIGLRREDSQFKTTSSSAVAQLPPAVEINTAGSVLYCVIEK